MAKETIKSLHRIARLFKMPYELVKWAYQEDRKYYKSDIDALYGLVEGLKGDNC